MSRVRWSSCNSNVSLLPCPPDTWQQLSGSSCGLSQLWQRQQQPQLQPQLQPPRPNSTRTFTTRFSKTRQPQDCRTAARLHQEHRATMQNHVASSRASRFGSCSHDGWPSACRYPDCMSHCGAHVVRPVSIIAMAYHKQGKNLIAISL